MSVNFVYAHNVQTYSSGHVYFIHYYCFSKNIFIKIGIS